MSQKELDAVTVLVWGFYCQTPLQNTKKNQKQKLLQGIKWEENQKGGIKVKKSKSSMNSVKGGKISKIGEQVTKIRRLQKFTGLENFAVLLFASSHLIFASLFFWFMLLFSSGF